MRAGADSGWPLSRAKKSRGLGSNVSTVGGRPRCAASETSSASIAWWPRWTPSKLPIVSAQLAARPGWRRLRKTRMAADYGMGPRSRHRRADMQWEDASHVAAAACGGTDHAVHDPVLLLDRTDGVLHRQAGEQA